MDNFLNYFNDNELNEKRFSSADSRYQIGRLTYPEGLGVQPDLQHYVAFYINVRGKSKMASRRGANDQLFKLTNPTVGQNRISNNDLGNAAPKIAFTQGVIGTVGGAALFSQKPAQIGAGLAKGAAVGTAAAGVVAGVQQLPLLKPDETYRLKDVITLHVEERPSVKYSANYQNKELGILAGALGGGGSATQSAGLLDTASEAGAALALQIAKIPSIIGFDQAAQALQLSAKVTTNPFREVFFESVDFRTFNFRYKFFPKSKPEANKVQDIINTFKYHMHPELANNGLFYIYPSEFEIKYFYRDRENTNFQKISTCVLTDMQVEYGGEQFSSFRDGSPVEYTMTLTFQELEILTKDRIEEGY